MHPKPEKKGVPHKNEAKTDFWCFSKKITLLPAQRNQRRERDYVYVQYISTNSQAVSLII